MLNDFSIATFEPLLGSTFRVRPAAGVAVEGGAFGVEVALVAVERAGASERSFGLRFRGGPGTFLPQGTFTFEHPALGSFEMFVSPTSRTAEGFTTEAVFNRLPEP